MNIANIISNLDYYKCVITFLLSSNFVNVIQLLLLLHLFYFYFLYPIKITVLCGESNHINDYSIQT